MSFKNSPSVTNESREGMVKKYVHQPLTIEHFGIHAKIQPNGKVLIQSVPVKSPEDGSLEYDEVEIPASLVFKLASALQMTRETKYVSVSEAKGMKEDI